MRRSLVLVVMVGGGCVMPIAQNSDTLRARAAFDMRCPAAQLRVTEIDSVTAGVDGCGQRGTYVFSPAVNAWVLNSPGAGPNQALFEAPPPPPMSSSPAGVPPGAPPGTIPGALPGTPPGTLPGTLPGAPPGSPPGTPPGAPHR
jgi:hypothetical protein